MEYRLPIISKIVSLLPVRLFFVAFVVWHINGQGSWSGCVPTPVCAQRKGISVSVPPSPSFSGSSTYLVSFVITENASHCAQILCLSE